jgi:hypothetical protein
VELTIANAGTESAPFHEHQARHGPLVLQVEDPHGRRVLLPPPAPPDERDLGPPTMLAPGESRSFTYGGLLDTRRQSGRYRVRFFSPHEAFGGSPRDPLASDWVVFEVDSARLDPKRPGLLYRITRWVRTWIAALFRRFEIWRCRAVIGVEVDRYVTETITDGTPAQWNNTYAWNARFHVQLDQPQQRIVVTIRVRPVGTTAAVVNPWIGIVETSWTNRFKDCAVLGCASNGYPILLRLQFVATGEHHAVSLAPGRTEHMLSWGLSDTDQGHEAGHMLGNKEEYFTVDGVAYGAARQPTGNIMNNPVNPPIAAHYWLIQMTVDELFGINYSLAGGSTRSINTPCSFI